MGRIIGEGVINEFNLRDPISGDVLTLYFRFPTTEERQAYMSAMFERDENKIRFKISEARQEFGLKILTGIKKGSFILVENGRPEKQISSDPKDPDYLKNWRELVAKQGIDVVEEMAAHVFEGHRVESVQRVKGGEKFTPKNS
jgi:hypothetical protein